MEGKTTMRFRRGWYSGGSRGRGSSGSGSTIAILVVGKT